MGNVDGTPIYVGGDLESAGAWMNAQAGDAVDKLQALRQLLAPLAETWTRSQAADYYSGLQNEWDLAAEGLFGPDGVLGQIAHVMNVNWTNYFDAETSNIATWSH